MRYPPVKPEGVSDTASPVVQEKGALQSKKFVAFLLCEIGFFGLMAVMVLQQDINSLGGNAAFMVLAITAGVLAASYIGGQALVDTYVRAAAMALGKETKT